MALHAGLAIALVVAGARIAPSHMQSRPPDNPCDVLTLAQMSNASGLDITSSARVEAIAKYPGSTAAVSGVGADAWLAHRGGADEPGARAQLRSS